MVKHNGLPWFTMTYITHTCQGEAQWFTMTYISHTKTMVMHNSLS